MTYDQSQYRAQIMRDIKREYGSEFLTDTEAAKFFGFRSVRNANHILSEIDSLPGKKTRYYIGSIASYIVKNTKYAGAS